jgi:hypothetical protein
LSLYIEEKGKDTDWLNKSTDVKLREIYTCLFGDILADLLYCTQNSLKRLKLLSGKLHAKKFFDYLD